MVLFSVLLPGKAAEKKKSVPSFQCLSRIYGLLPRPCTPLFPPVSCFWQTADARAGFEPSGNVRASLTNTAITHSRNPFLQLGSLCTLDNGNESKEGREREREHARSLSTWTARLSHCR